MNPSSWVVWGASWLALVRSWEPLGAILRPLGVVLGRSWVLLGPSWGLLGCSWGALGVLLEPLGVLLGPPGALQNRSKNRFEIEAEIEANLDGPKWLRTYVFRCFGDGDASTGIRSGHPKKLSIGLTKGLVLIYLSIY